MRFLPIPLPTLSESITQMRAAFIYISYSLYAFYNFPADASQWVRIAMNRSFARTAHSFACSALLPSHARCAALIRSLAYFAHSLARGTAND